LFLKVSELKRGGLAGNRLNQVIYASYGIVEETICPVEAKPVYCYPLNEHDVEGAVDGIKQEWTKKGWRKECAGARAMYIDMGKWYFAISGWKRSKSFQDQKAE